MSDSSQGNPEGTEVVERLTEAGVVTEGADDLELTERFGDDWDRRIDRLEDGEPTEYLALLLQVHPDELTVEASGDTLSVTRDGTSVGEWPSETALVADVAAATLLREWVSGWGEFDPDIRDELIARLRLFLDSCPDCSGELLQQSADTQLVRYVCTDCGARLV
jgi:hypothetical protein